MMARNAGSDLKSICYWLSVACGLCSSLEEDGYYGGDVKKDGIVPPSDDFKTIDQIKNSSQLEIAMKLFTFDIYNLLLSHVYDELDMFIEQSFIRGADLVFDQKVKYTDPHRSIEVTTRILDKLLDAFHSNFCYEIIIYQCFSQVIYYISASLFNRVVSTPSYCTPRIGLQIKMSASHLISWLYRNSKTDHVLEDAMYVLLFIIYNI